MVDTEFLVIRYSFDKRGINRFIYHCILGAYDFRLFFLTH